MGPSAWPVSRKDSPHPNAPLASCGLRAWAGFGEIGLAIRNPASEALAAPTVTVSAHSSRKPSHDAATGTNRARAFARSHGRSSESGVPMATRQGTAATGVAFRGQ